jgi:hypothetical protein
MQSLNTPASRPAVDVEADLSRKILRVHFRGVVTAEDMHAPLDGVRELVGKLGPGFSLLTDLSELQEMEIDTVRDLARMMDLCLESGLKQVVRVIPDPSKDIGFHLLSITHYRGRVPVATCETRAEAERILSAAG